MKEFWRVEHADGEQMFCHNFMDKGNAHAFMLGVLESYKREGHNMQQNNKFFFTSLNSDVFVRLCREIFADFKEKKQSPKKKAVVKEEKDNVAYVDFKSGTKFADKASWEAWKKLG